MISFLSRVLKFHNGTHQREYTYICHVSMLDLLGQQRYSQSSQPIRLAMNLFVYMRRVTITIANERKAILTATMGLRSEVGLAKLDISPIGGRSAGISDKPILGRVAKDIVKFQCKEELRVTWTCVSFTQRKHGAMPYFFICVEPTVEWPHFTIVSPFSTASPQSSEEIANFE